MHANKNERSYSILNKNSALAFRRRLKPQTLDVSTGDKITLPYSNVRNKRIAPSAYNKAPIFDHIMCRFVNGIFDI